jgi:hypothetical protein
MKSDMEFRVQAWQKHQSALEQEMNRVNFLNKPLPQMNPPALTKLVKIKRIGRGFIANGKPVELDEIVRVPYACAKELVYLKKAEFVDPPEAA